MSTITEVENEGEKIARLRKIYSGQPYTQEDKWNKSLFMDYA